MDTLSSTGQAVWDGLCCTHQVFGACDVYGCTITIQWCLPACRMNFPSLAAPPTIQTPPFLQWPNANLCPFPASGQSCGKFRGTVLNKHCYGNEPSVRGNMYTQKSPHFGVGVLGFGGLWQVVLWFHPKTSSRCGLEKSEIALGYPKRKRHCLVQRSCGNIWK